MKTLTSILVAGAILALPMVASAEEASLAFGGDQYSAGQNAQIEAAVERDAFIAGYEVAVTAPVNGDSHLAGFNVRSAAPVSGDVYAAGFSVGIDAAVGGDLTAIGNNVSLRSAAPVTGNARLAGQTVNVTTPVSGSILISAQTLTLDSVVAGDLIFLGESISFGPAARIDGKVDIRAPKEIAVPVTVATADRVSFTQLVNPDYVGEAGRTAESVVKSFWPAFWATAAWLLFLLVVGAALIALVPGRIRGLQTASQRRPFRAIGIGILAFASTLGLVPVAALTLIGLLAIPFILIYIVVACSLAYLAGTYLVGLRIGGAFLHIDSNVKRLAVLAVSLVAAVVLGNVPVLGWLITLLILTYGFGVISVVTIARWSAADAPRVQAATPVSGEAVQI
jgi:hypothetical protein